MDQPGIGSELPAGYCNEFDYFCGLPETAHDKMHHSTRSPLFYLAFALSSALIHYAILSGNLYGLLQTGGGWEYFFEPLASEAQRPFATGPLIYAYFKPFAALPCSPDTGYLLGSALLTGMLTYALVRFTALMRGPAPVLYLAGLWSAVSPTTVLLAFNHPHVLLGLSFLLLLVNALRRNNTFLAIVFAVHLLLTHGLAGLLALILIASLWARTGKIAYLAPLVPAAILIILFWPGVSGLAASSHLFPGSLSPPERIHQANLQNLPAIWWVEWSLMFLLFAGWLIRLFIRLRASKKFFHLF